MHPGIFKEYCDLVQNSEVDFSLQTSVEWICCVNDDNGVKQRHFIILVNGSPVHWVEPVEPQNGVRSSSALKVNRYIEKHLCRVLRQTSGMLLH